MPGAEGDPAGRPTGTRLTQRVVTASRHAAPAPSSVLVPRALSLPASGRDATRCGVRVDAPPALGLCVALVDSDD